MSHDIGVNDMDIRSKIFCDLSSFCEGYFKGRDYFACIYGSYASKDFTNQSDLDLFIATNEYNGADFEKVRDFVVDLHTKNGLKINEELPYRNKLIVLYKDIIDATNLEPFLKSGSKYLVPPIEDNREYLASREVRLRMILNALTSPNECICGNREEYETFKHKAEKALIHLACGLIEKDHPTRDDILHILLKGTHGEESGVYLGYRNKRVSVVEYLKDLISRNLTL